MPQGSSPAAKRPSKSGKELSKEGNILKEKQTQRRQRLWAALDFRPVKYDFNGATFANVIAHNPNSQHITVLNLRHCAKLEDEKR